MRVLFRPEARSELLEAQAWYESRATGLGLEFARVVEAAVASASRSPTAFHRSLARVGASFFASFRFRSFSGCAEMSFL